MRYLVPLLASLLLCGCAKQQSTQFESAFQQAFNKGDTNALLALVQWRDMPEKMRHDMIWQLTTYMGEQQITETTLVPFDTQPTIAPVKLLADLEPKFWLHVRTESLPGLSNPPPMTARQFLVGVEDEKFFICGFRFD